MISIFPKSLKFNQLLKSVSPITLAISKSEYYGSLFIYYICLLDKVNYLFIYLLEGGALWNIWFKKNNGSALVQLIIGMHGQLFI